MQRTFFRFIVMMVLALGLFLPPTTPAASAGLVKGFGAASVPVSARPGEATFHSDGQEVTFNIGPYDASHALMIGPGLTWLTFLGATGSEWANGIVADGSGNVYVTGTSNDNWGCLPSAPCTVRPFGGANGDVFVAKLDSSGNLIWNTFLGSGDSDTPGDIAIDGNEHIYVTGTSLATWGCPSSAPCTKRDYSHNSDVFVAQLDSSGNLLWNTFLGASGWDDGLGLTVDGNGNVYATGDSDAAWGCSTTPCTVHANSGNEDAFVAKLNSSGVLQWNTFLGGGTVDDFDQGQDLTLDGSGNIYVLGDSYDGWSCTPTPCTRRPHAPTIGSSHNYDAFVAKLDSSGVLQWNTFLGGGGNDWEGGIAVDSSGNIYVAADSYDEGWGCSPTPCTVRPYGGGSDGFVSRLDTDGNLIWNTFLGTSAGDGADGIVLYGTDNLYITGWSAGGWGCSPTPCTMHDYEGNDDAYFARLDTSGNLVQNGFIGGSSGGEYGAAIAVPDGLTIYIAGESDAGWGSPIRPYFGGADGMVVTLPSSFVAISGSTVAGATLTYTGDTSGSTEADASGDYSITVPSGWSGTVTPSFAGCTFSPPDQTHGNVTANITGEDFGATCSLTVKSVANNDGWVLESGENTNAGGSMDSAATTLNLGDDAANKQYRGILSFNTSTLPGNAVIDSLKLRFKKSGVVGADPFSSMGKIAVDIKKGSFSNSPALQKGDFQAAANQNNAALIVNTLVSGWYNRTLPSGSFGFVNLTGTTQFRLRFQTDDNNNHVADFLQIFSGNAAASSRPQLVITYHAP